MLRRVRVEVLDYVVALSLQQVVIVILDEVVLDLLAADPAFVLAVDATVGSVWLESCQLSKRLPLPLDTLLLLCDSQH